MYKNLINVTNRVYGQLQDDISKDIYKARVLNSITYDYNYITQIAVDGLDIFKYLREQLKPFIEKKTKLILDGAGYYGRSIKRTLDDIHFECFSDGNPNQDTIMGIPVISRREAVLKYKDALFVITSMVYDKQIKKELEQLGVKYILDFGAYLNKNSTIRDNQYYDILNLTMTKLLQMLVVMIVIQQSNTLNVLLKNTKEYIHLNQNQNNLLNAKK